MRCVDLTGRGVLHAAIVGEATADVEESTRDAIVRRLLQAGADVHCADEDGKNMCHHYFFYTYCCWHYCVGQVAQHYIGPAPKVLPLLWQPSWRQVQIPMWAHRVAHPCTLRLAGRGWRWPGC